VGLPRRFVGIISGMSGAGGALRDLLLGGGSLGSSSSAFRWAERPRALVVTGTSSTSSVKAARDFDRGFGPSEVGRLRASGVLDRRPLLGGGVGVARLNSSGFPVVGTGIGSGVGATGAGTGTTEPALSLAGLFFQPSMGPGRCGGSVRIECDPLGMIPAQPPGGGGGAGGPCEWGSWGLTVGGGAAGWMANCWDEAADGM